MSDVKLIPLPDLIQSLRDAAAGVVVWCVTDPNDGSSCFSLSERNNQDAELQVRSWFESFSKAYPQHRFCSFEVKRRVVRSKAELLLLQTADQLERRLKGCEIHGPVSKFVITLDDDEFEVLSNRERFIERELLACTANVQLSIQREGE